MRNDCLKAALDELAAAGIRDVIQVPGGKHPQIRWRMNGQLQVYSLPATPSDCRAPANTRTDVRRLLKAAGRLFDQPKPVRVRPPSIQEEVRLLKLEVRNLKAEMAEIRNRTARREGGIGD